MPFGGKKAKGKGKGFNLDCVLGNAAITVVTCCGFIFQGVVVEEDDENTRAQYGCPVVFPAMTMGYDKEENDCKDDDDKADKKPHCPKPVEVDVDVKCNNDPKFICLRLTCPPAFVCCPTIDLAVAVDLFAAVIGVGVTLGGVFTPLFSEDDTILIGLDEIAAIGPSVACLA
ncbi:hypothetical protein SOV_46320 [Sporomusa ovata DSM 2662]|uniref:Uncharacterized protein n=1 Tax=Sporomusa ovata TaxID=2378 RepID=A0A0U1KV21_9FIRM|nr:hypothetical protein [Sporomusa ovata]EQB27020.1 hypothetical protein SOV_3c08940 [Sporomusa ovata DSM 2662]CQR71125.1 hypothetical protein SpAn4DRAFT_2103 [Sporomusa ovata]